MAKRTQGLAKPTRTSVQLTKEACAAITLQCREASQSFRKALEGTWQVLDNAAIKIASKHKKSVRRVQNELHMGHSLLHSKHSKVSAWNSFLWKKGQDGNKENYGRGKDILKGIVKDFKDEYNSLTEEEKANLVEEYKEYKATKTTGQCISTKSKINDVTNTLKAVESELNNLCSRTGAETIMYVVRGTTDLPLRGSQFATEGVQSFMESAMGIDNQDLVSKLEGFAIQGMTGAAKNHQQRVAEVRAVICSEIIKPSVSIKTVAKDPDAKMQWVQYWRNVVKRYSVIIEGWPEQIPFANLSTVSNSLPELEMLLRKWRSGAIYWKRLTPEELERMDKERDKGIEDGAIVEKRRHTRSDKGKKRRHDADADDAPQRQRKKVYKSTEMVSSDDEEENPDVVPNTTNDIPGSPATPSPSSDIADTPVSSASSALTPPLVTDHANTTPAPDPMLSQSINNPPFPDFTPQMTSPLFTSGSFEPGSDLNLPPGLDDFLLMFNPSFKPYSDGFNDGGSSSTFF
ncbi:hypothetical protein EV702DRAFT_962745 [Suillus placidus]|uniref:Uncharacterized protein n=1 Tax=Suillus placidus TaxID=48579 RepID=A0A9P7D5Q7_9AGAM|nr:hypothetical protein EV702DRAFT_962745 [Suillus placidus]